KRSNSHRLSPRKYYEYLLRFRQGSVRFRMHANLKFSIRGLLTLVFLSLTGLVTHAATRQLNVLLIISDDLRDTVGCYGKPTAKTPNIDKLAARGVRFDRAYAQYPVCNPSRTSFLTGLRCEQTRVVDNRTMFRTRLPDIVTFPQLLRHQGWYTASFGKV